MSRVDDPRDFGTIILDEERRIVDFQEKIGKDKKFLTSTKKSNDAFFVNAGVYCFSQDVFALMPSQKSFSLEKDFFPRQKGRNFFGFEVEEEFFDIGTPERYANVKNSPPLAGGVRGGGKGHR